MDEKKPYKIRLAVPGVKFDFGCFVGMFGCMTGDHYVDAKNSGNGFDDFNNLWADALRDYEAGLITHFSMLHSDVHPQKDWLGIIVNEMDRLDAALVSVPIPLKDSRGVCSCGIGDLLDPYQPLRRFTVREIIACEHDTFNAAMMGYEGLPLLHNTGCFCLDLRKPEFWTTDEAGDFMCHFGFPQRIARDSNGIVRHYRESEDWFLSRQLFKLKSNTFITRKVGLVHRGNVDYPNNIIWGSDLDGDETLAHKWRNPQPVEYV